MHGSDFKLGFLVILTNHKMADDDGVTSGGTGGGGKDGE